MSFVQSPSQISSMQLLLQNFSSVFNENFLTIYNIGVPESDLLPLEGSCNMSYIKCSIIAFDYYRFPSYILDAKLHLFRPLIIKHALTHFHSIFFVDPTVRLIGLRKVFYSILKNTSYVKSLKIQKLPVTSFTHAKMFEYFDAEIDAFLFAKQVTLDAVFFRGSQFLENRILLPWVKCVLTPREWKVEISLNSFISFLIAECTVPIGSNFERNHCRYDKKPKYRYSGCHS